MSVITEFAATEIVSRANVNQRIADANSVLSSVVPSTRTINSKPLSTDITLTAADVGAVDATVQTGVITAISSFTWTGNNTCVLKQGKVCTLYVNGTLTVNVNKNGTACHLFTLPTGFRPQQTYARLSCNSGIAGQRISNISIDANGTVSVYNDTNIDGGSGNPITLFVTYIVA